MKARTGPPVQCPRCQQKGGHVAAISRVTEHIDLFTVAMMVGLSACGMVHRSGELFQSALPNSELCRTETHLLRSIDAQRSPQIPGPQQIDTVRGSATRYIGERLLFKLTANRKIDRVVVESYASAFR
jgi:hypothetical protein